MKNFLMAAVAAVSLGMTGAAVAATQPIQHQGRRLHTQAQLRAEICQLNSPAGPNEQPGPHFMLQGANRFRHGGLRKMQPLGRFAEM